MRARTPLMTLVRSITVRTKRRGTRSPSSSVNPSWTNCVPGRSGNHLLSMLLERSKLSRSKSSNLLVLGSLAALRHDATAGQPETGESHKCNQGQRSLTKPAQFLCHHNLLQLRRNVVRKISTGVSAKPIHAKTSPVRLGQI